MTIKTWIANPDVWPKHYTEPQEVKVEKPKPRPKPEKPRKPKKRGRPHGAKDSYQRQRLAIPTISDDVDFFKETRQELQAIRAGEVPARVRPRR